MENRKKISNKRSVELLEEILNKYNQSLYVARDKSMPKTFKDGIGSIQISWQKAFTRDKLQIIGALDLEEYINKENIGND